MPKYRCTDLKNQHAPWRDITANSASAAAERYAAIRDAMSQAWLPETVVMVMDSVGVVGFYVVASAAQPSYTARPMSARGIRVFEEQG